MIMALISESKHTVMARLKQAPILPENSAVAAAPPTSKTPAMSAGARA